MYHCEFYSCINVYNGMSFTMVKNKNSAQSNYVKFPTISD